MKLTLGCIALAGLVFWANSERSALIEKDYGHQIHSSCSNGNATLKITVDPGKDSLEMKAERDFDGGYLLTYNGRNIDPCGRQKE